MALTRGTPGVLLLIAVALLATFGLGPTAAFGDCPEPTVEASATNAEPGETIVVTGHHWASACDDTCGGAPCSGCDDPTPPARGISVRLERTAGDLPAPVLAEGIDAGDDLGFEVEVVVPPDLDDGRYRIVATSAGGRAARSDPIRISSG